MRPWLSGPACSITPTREHRRSAARVAQLDDLGVDRLQADVTGDRDAVVAVAHDVAPRDAVDGDRGKRGAARLGEPDPPPAIGLREVGAEARVERPRPRRLDRPADRVDRDRLDAEWVVLGD